MSKKKNAKNEYPIGCVVEYRDIDYIQRDLAIKLLSKEQSYIYQVLYSVIQDDAMTLELMDIFADKKVKFPSRKRLCKALERAKIYTYVKRHNGSTTSINVIAKQYKKRPSQVKIMVERIDEILDSKDYPGLNEDDI